MKYTFIKNVYHLNVQGLLDSMSNDGWELHIMLLNSPRVSHYDFVFKRRDENPPA